MKRVICMMAAVGLALAAFAPRAEAAAKQMQITFGGYTNRSEVLTNFPVLVVLSNNVGQNFTFADFVTTNGTDLRFATNSASTDWLNYEIESWNTNAGQASYVWVQVPTIPTNGQGAIWANWGDAAASNRLPCTTNGAVWTNGYVGVWHLPDASNSTARDSTSNRYDGTVTSVTATNAMVDGAGGFNGTSSKIVIGDKDVFSSNVLTLDAWIKPNSGSLSGLKTILSKRNNDEYAFWLNGGKAAVAVWQGGADILTGNTGLSAGQRYHVVSVISASSISIYLNGTSDCTPLSRTKTIQNTTDPVIIGWDNVNSARYFDGVLDEVRISTVARSSNWVWACYLNQASNTVFNNYGAMTAAAAPGTLIIANRPVTSLTTNSATFNGTLTSTGSSACAVCVYWGADTNAWANTNWFNGGAVNVDWTNNTPFSTNIIGLSPMTTYYYTYGASNATTNVVASGPVSLTTISLPSVTNLGAQTRRTWARLGGQVLTTGGDTPTCWFAWWQNGFATTSTVPMGTQSGVFSTELSTLAAGTTYGYLVTASNSAGTVTSESRNFTTLGSGQIAWYAATNGTDGAGSNWFTAITNLQTVLDTAASNDTIYIAGHAFGIATQLVWTTSYVTVRGGYAATNAADQPGPSDPTRWPTVIQRASGTTRILYVNGVTNGTLDQVTISGGNLDGGGGLRVAASTNFLLSGCTVQSNAFVIASGVGGGIYVAANSAMTVSNCVIRNNTGDDSGAGYHYAAGGGIYTLGILTLRDSAIVQNSITAYGWSGGGYGGGLYFSGQKLTVQNVLVMNNISSYQGAGIQVNAGAATLGNCTIVNHTGTEGLRRSGGTLGVTNCIFWGNTTDTNGAMTVGYSLFGSDPLFEYGYYLAAGSPASNAGSDTAANLGLQSYAKNAAGATYGAGEIVNLGYHYRTGAFTAYADLYVAPSPLGNDSNDGTNALTPFKTMTKALGVASDGTRIHVAAGTYATNSGEAFPLTVSGKSGVKILGAGAGNTVLDAVGAGARVLGLSAAHNTVLDGLTLKRGVANGGGGLRIENSLNVVLSGCVVESNTCTAASVTGPGIYAASDTSVTLSNCVVRGNTGDDPGAGTHWAQGGGIYSLGTLTLRDSTVMQNAITAADAWAGGGFGGGLYFGGSTLILRNVLVANNNATHTGDGLYVNNGTVGLMNVTVAGNAGEGVRRAGGTVSVKDSILWSNGVDSTGGVTLAWSCYSNSTDHVNGGNNTNANPLFVDTTYYHLKSRGGNYVGGYFSGGTWANASESSPCIDAGDPTSDYSREPEPNGRQVNLGAYGNTPVASKKLPGGTVFTFR